MQICPVCDSRENLTQIYYVVRKRFLRRLLESVAGILLAQRAEKLS
jgi:hypothetical protein